MEWIGIGYTPHARNCMRREEVVYDVYDANWHDDHKALAAKEWETSIISIYLYRGPIHAPQHIALASEQQQQQQ